jgi:hypothetical protein
MLGLLFTHELDAMTRSEWRLLYILRSLSDDDGRWWFVAIHGPLFGLMIWLTGHVSTSIRNGSRWLLAVFCIIHLGLHIRLRNDPLSHFEGGLSWFLIVAPALLGVLHLIAASVLSKRATKQGSVL